MNSSVENIENEFDIIQAPLSIKKSDLPDIIEINKPFNVNGILYILVKSDKSGFSTCQEIPGEEKTYFSKKALNYYIIKKL